MLKVSSIHLEVLNHFMLMKFLIKNGKMLKHNMKKDLSQQKKKFVQNLEKKYSKNKEQLQLKE